MSDYLEDAAAELRKARDANESRAAASVHSWHAERDVPVILEINARRMELAAAFTRLAECQAAMLATAWMPTLPATAPKRQDPENPS